MNRIQHDIGKFLRTPDGKPITYTDPGGNQGDGGKPKGVNLSFVLIAITLLVIAVAAFIYIISKGKNQTKDSINESKQTIKPEPNGNN